MRICFISQGQFLHTDAYLDYFKSSGYEVHYISLTPTPEREVPTYNLGFGKKYSNTEGKWKYPISMLRARRLVQRLKPDIVHTHYASSGGLAGLVCNLHPTIVTVHGTDLMVKIKSGIWRLLLKAVFNHADCINTVSEDLKNMTLSLGIPPDKIKTFTLGINTEKFSFLERPIINRNQPLKFVCTRALAPVYDHPTIINALGILKRKDIDFRTTFVGTGDMKEKLEQQTADLGLTDRVTFLGSVENNELPKILHGNDAYLSSSIRDGTSLCLLEAMATGIFPIVSRIKANTAWLDDGESGLLYKVGDADDLAKCIMKLLNQPEIAVEAARRNRKKVVEKGDRNNNMKCLERIYKDLIDKTHTGETE